MGLINIRCGRFVKKIGMTISTDVSEGITSARTETSHSRDAERKGSKSIQGDGIATER